MKFYVDCEFNEFRGELISMALACEDGTAWYEVLPCMCPGPWVAQHVMPVLNQEPLASRELLARSLARYLSGYSACHIVADWPEDIAHFCQALIIGPGQRVDTPPLTFEIDQSLPDTATHSRIPHNALCDAVALRDAMHQPDAGEGEGQADG
jgi:hypothetical protein